MGNLIVAILMAKQFVEESLALILKQGVQQPFWPLN